VGGFKGEESQGVRSFFALQEGDNFGIKRDIILMGGKELRGQPLAYSEGRNCEQFSKEAACEPDNRTLQGGRKGVKIESARVISW